MSLGTVFDIKEFSIYDGEGMRCTVFLKGCPLSCKWCHNPEGLSVNPQVMVKTANCSHCGKCHIPYCDFLTKGKCNGCGKCVNLCPNNLRSISGVKYSSDELIDKLNGYSLFFGEDGGITFSGGEPTLQHEFLYDVLCGVKGKSAIETSGYCEEKVFEKILSKLSFVYFDFKMFDSKKHIYYTGVDNVKIINNLNCLSCSDKPFIVRIPMIKGVNDDKENLIQTVNLLKNSKNLKRVEILPYNSLAPAKYPMVGMEFNHNFSKPDNIHTSVFDDAGISYKIL